MTVGHPDIAWDTLLFSAKEAVYKAWHPLVGRWLDFSDVCIDFDAAGSFVAVVLTEVPTIDGRPLHSLDGAWSVSDGVLLTAAWVPPE